MTPLVQLSPGRTDPWAQMGMREKLVDPVNVNLTHKLALRLNGHLSMRPRRPSITNGSHDLQEEGSPDAISPAFRVR